MHAITCSATIVTASIHASLQIKARLNSIFVFALCLILLVFVKINSCATYVQTWLGLGPMAAMETATIISNMYFYMPKSPDLKEPMIQASPCLQVHLQPHASIHSFCSILETASMLLSGVTDSLIPPTQHGLRFPAIVRVLPAAEARIQCFDP